MKFFLVPFVLFACALLAGFMNAQDASKGANSYEALVERAKNKDQTLDFRQLRFAYADSTAPKTDTDEDKKAMMKATREKDFAAVIKHSEVVLASNYADMDAHFVEYVAHKERNEDELASLHKFIFQGLMNSIVDSGDGKTPETAYVVIDVHEEYVVLHFMGVGMPKSQSYLHKNGHAYDAIVFMDPKTNTESTVYFNVDIPAKHGL